MPPDASLPPRPPMRTAGAYYNEIDPFAAAWLRNLIAAGLIAPGDVDERSIADVSPDDLRGYRQCHRSAPGSRVHPRVRRNRGPPDASLPPARRDKSPTPYRVQEVDDGRTA